MKKLLLTFILSIFTFSCASRNYNNVEKIHFYDKIGNKIELSNIYDILNNQLKEQNINGKIIKSQIKEFKNDKSRKIVLIGISKENNLNIGAELSNFKKGFKLNNYFTICNNCQTENKEINIDYKDDNLICKSKINSNCVKHSIAIIDN
ncbi:hypothetical protein [Faecalibacter rhinopitheci]|uniref:Lipoprotein n=1 Tax=Faecalibacter rhinopitheci TaxID=2779678 RepID=A0A8J7K5N0_9FLAO|nr:hypothetical protein [Faecalibacter rhinopitheci]MBF0598463.1 hypothetical protein [Faecalibacter rhinopitheci]